MHNKIESSNLIMYNLKHSSPDACILYIHLCVHNIHSNSKTDRQTGMKYVKEKVIMKQNYLILFKNFCIVMVKVFGRRFCPKRRSEYGLKIKWWSNNEGWLRAFQSFLKAAVLTWSNSGQQRWPTGHWWGSRHSSGSRCWARPARAGSELRIDTLQQSYHPVGLQLREMRQHKKYFNEVL